MPFTYAAFLIGALSIIGLPPLGGSWSKYYLMLGAADTGQLVMIGVFMLSSLLNIAYLLPVVARGFYLGGRPAHALSAAPSSRGGIQEAPIWCVVPPCLTAIGCILLFFYAGDIYTLIEPVAFPAGTLPEGASLP